MDNNDKRIDIDTMKTTPAGALLKDLFSQHDFVVGMAVMSEHGKPAVEHAGKRLADHGFSLTDPEKRTVGRWVRQVMEDKGWTVSGKKGRVSPNKTFSTGEIYVQKS